MREPTEAIAGVGITAMGKIYGQTATDWAAQAVELAVADAGLTLPEVDGLLINPGSGVTDLGLPLARRLGLQDLHLLSVVQAYGSSAGAMVGYACQAIRSGMAQTVVCVFADAPLTEGRRSGDAYRRAGSPTGEAGLRVAAGLTSVNAAYALAARRHMATYGTTSEQLGHVAVAQRAWAQHNPRALMTDDLTLEQHQASRMIADPFHLFDCCMVSNGGVALVITSAERARDLRQPGVGVRGFAQAHPGYSQDAESTFGLVSGARESGRRAFEMAGASLSEVTAAQIYDCYTFTVLISLEDYGFCAKGEGGEFVSSGAIAPGGSLPVNTGGGQLSSFYMWGMTPMSEAVIQARGHGADRQVPDNDLILVSGNGGVLDHHSTTLLSPLD